MGIDESNFQCGVHMPCRCGGIQVVDCKNHDQPTPNHNNCSGKHTAMLAHAKMRGLSLENYLDIDHPIQQDILASFAEMCQIPVNEVELGTDGCSRPNFAVSAYITRRWPWRVSVTRASLSERRAAACRKITSAMTAYPEMVSGYGEFDERIDEDRR